MDLFHPVKRGGQNAKRATILSRNKDKLQTGTPTPNNENDLLGGPFIRRTLLSSPTSRLPIDLMIFLAIESSVEKKLTCEQILKWIEGNIYQSAKSAFDYSTWSQMVLKQLVYNRSFYLKRNESDTVNALWAFNETYRHSIKEKLYSDIFFLKLRLFLPRINSLLDSFLSREVKVETAVKTEVVKEEEKEESNLCTSVEVHKIDSNLDEQSFKFRAFKLDHPYSIVDHPSYNSIGKNMCNDIQELEPIAEWSRENVLTSHDCTKQKCVNKYLSIMSDSSDLPTPSGESTNVENPNCGGKKKRKQELVPIGDNMNWKTKMYRRGDVNGNDIKGGTLDIKSDVDGATHLKPKKGRKCNRPKNKINESTLLAKREAEELINELENVTIPENLFSPLKNDQPTSQQQNEMLGQENDLPASRKKRKMAAPKRKIPYHAEESSKIEERPPEVITNTIVEPVEISKELLDTVAVNDESTLWGDYVIIGDCNESSDTEVFIDITDESDGENVIVDVDSVSLPDCSSNEAINDSMLSSESSATLSFFGNHSELRFKENESMSIESDQRQQIIQQPFESSKISSQSHNHLYFSSKSSSLNNEAGYHRLIHIPSQSALSKILIRKRKNRDIRKHVKRVVQRKLSMDSPKRAQSSLPTKDTRYGKIRRKSTRALSRLTQNIK